MGKRVSVQKVKKDRHYTYEEAADLLRLTSHTVRSWRPKGLSVMDSRKPHLILGEALIEYVERNKTKRSLQLCVDQMLCFTCKAPRRPLGGLVDYVPFTDTRGRLVGLCEVCEGSVQKFATKARLHEFDEIFDIAIKNRT